ncbi:MAG: hypothetical protein AB7O64_20065, partial [Methylibium sp.]
MSTAGIKRCRPPALGQSSIGRVGQSSVGADSLEISHAEDAFQLGLIDDGCGIGSVPRRSGSIGLFSMTERA